MMFFLEWAGTALVILAYGLSQFGFLEISSVFYMLMNAVGAGFLGFLFWKKKVYGPLVLQSIWSSVAVIALFRYFFF